MAFPGKREIMAEYLLVRPPPPPEEQEQPKGGQEDAKEEEKPPSATEGKEGKAGGEGEKPRAKAPDPDKGNPDEPPKSVQVGLLTKSSRAQIRQTLDRDRLALMRPEAFLINTARGDVVDEAALVETLASKRIAGAENKKNRINK